MSENSCANSDDRVETGGCAETHTTAQHACNDLFQVDSGPCVDWERALRATIAADMEPANDLLDHLHICPGCAAVYDKFVLSPPVLERTLREMFAARGLTPGWTTIEAFPDVTAEATTQAPESWACGFRVEAPREAAACAADERAFMWSQDTAQTVEQIFEPLHISMGELVVASSRSVTQSARSHKSKSDQAAPPGAASYSGAADRDQHAVVSTFTLPVWWVDTISAPAALAETRTDPPPTPDAAPYLNSPQRLALTRHDGRPGISAPDNAAWRSEPGYSGEVADQLAAAYTLVKRKPIPHAADAVSARKRLAWCSSRTMSIHQRLCLNYASGLLEVADRKYEAAYKPLDDALEISRLIEEPGIRATLANLRGKASYYRQRYSAAADYFTLAVNLIRELNGKGVAHVDTALEVESLTPLASSCFFVEQFDSCGQYIDDARRLISPALKDQHPSGERDEQGTVAVRQKSAELEWAAALLHRWAGKPEVALRHAMAAAEEFTALKQPASTGRISTVVADIALDLVESFGEVGAAQSMSLPQQLYSAIAESYATMATLVLKRQADESGLQLATLTQARFERITSKDTDRPHKIAQVIDYGLGHDDRALLATAQTTLGDEFRVRGETESALTCYRLTLDTLRPTEYPALGIWARRRLMYTAEGLPI